MRVNTKIGDVFFVRTNDNSKKYFQYIINDLTQLNSDVIRAFKRSYRVDSNPDLLEITNGEIDFYAHCVISLGIKMGYWDKVGNINDIGRTDHILFRDSGDYGNPKIKISQDWWVWKVNGEQRQIGKLEGEYKKAEIGIVMDAESIVSRMKTGKYDGYYPAYE
jgi:hypothetical protein